NRARKERFAALAADLKNQRVVAAIDAEMKEMIEDWLDLSFLRERAAQRHKVNSPPPAFPVDPAVMAPSVYRKNSRQAPPTKPIQDLKLVNGSEADICWQIIEPRETGISTAEMRVEFASRIPGKSHHAGIQRLKNSRH